MNDQSFWLNCPGCGKFIEYQSDNPARPFCSMACKHGDLLTWAEQGYRIAGKNLAEEEGGALQEEEEAEEDSEL